MPESTPSPTVKAVGAAPAQPDPAVATEDLTLEQMKELIADFRREKEIEAKVAKDIKEKAPTSTGTTVIWDAELVKAQCEGIFFFGLITFLVIGALIWRNKSVDTLLRTFGVPLIIISAVFLVVAGYGPEQMAPVTGLLGTIAGYLLSRRSDSTPSAEPAADKTAKDRLEPPSADAP